jgi:putative FmdB family regulatory protein
MTYEYLCTACAHAWEAEQSISAAPLTTCPHCHTENAKRQVSGGAGFILKGGGWYSDLYASSPKKSGGDDTKSSDTKSSDTKTSSDSSSSKSSDTSTKSPDKGSSGSNSGSSSGSSGTPSSGGSPTSGTSSGSKAAGAPSGA